ncbi:hypothetical protein PRIPAC_95643 [Pristionchus pacificus]|uniref:Uncharacterized protein n=1 Tax=Pristionchus pacificus TaxID=54126 RepID=A0A2A6BDM9_PRIPA|nr:hypothetical protein PRIPAC_95643 [Pristionchus pacificus]|eukprot:PDM63984.1 hypothetical protein PRIPAC_49485 [Pristionchus pacificus]
MFNAASTRWVGCPVDTRTGVERIVGEAPSSSSRGLITSGDDEEWPPRGPQNGAGVQDRKQLVY